MHPDDPRHGSEAGQAQHMRDGDEPCDACNEADRIAARRRNKRKAMGYQYTRPIGRTNHAKLTQLKDSGARWDQLAEWAGVSTSQVWRILHGGPDTEVYARTYLRIAAMQHGRIVTSVGITRRIRALCWLGYSPARIAEEAGVNLDTVRDARDTVRTFIAGRVRDGIADAYDRLHMTSPSTANVRDRAGITRVRNLARARGWLPPLAWNDIDDPTEQPADWQYRPTSRVEQIRELAEAGVTVSEACRRLHCSRKTLEKYCHRNGIADVYGRMMRRETGGDRWGQFGGVA